MSVHEQDLEEIAEVVLAVQRAQVVDFGEAAVGARGEGVAVCLDLEQAGEPGSGHRQLFDAGAIVVALWAVEFLG